MKDRIKSYLAELFPNYRTVQVEPFLDKVTITKEHRNLESYKTFLGIKYAKKYSKTRESRTVYFTCDGNAYDLWADHRVYFVFGVDSESKTVYWKYNI
ncbi:hypothetical protein [Bacillus stercoris]|uniref:hypothetical protein n=1 Tax=Bacillus stercoris TaxID=2054641 RepID=UPI003CE78BBA